MPAVRVTFEVQLWPVLQGWRPRESPVSRSKEAVFCLYRFEMPYNIWCDGCKNHIGMGEFAPTACSCQSRPFGPTDTEAHELQVSPPGTLPIRSQGGDGAQATGGRQTPYRRVVRRPGAGFTS